MTGFKVYIAGPMSGLPDYNYPAFREAAEWLRAYGHDAVCPPELNEPGESLDQPAAHFLRRDLRALLDCDAIALLPGWERSVGASCEVAVALALGMVFYNERGYLIPAPYMVTCSSYRAPAVAEMRDEIGAPVSLTCPCGEPLVRGGYTVKSHWTGSICEDCEAAIFQKFAGRK